MSFDVTLLSDADTWMNAYMPGLQAALEAEGHRVRWVHRPAELPVGDIAIILSCTRLVGPELLARHRHNLVVHQSALPAGRGWSPLAWQVLEGASVVPVTLFEAAPDVDSGLVYDRDEIVLEGTELVDELRAKQAAASMRLVMRFMRRFPAVLAEARPQEGEASYYPRRGTEDSRLDPDKTLREQFNLLRIVDNLRYPAFFELGGETYVLRIEKRQRPAGWVSKVVPAAEGAPVAPEPGA